MTTNTAPAPTSDEIVAAIGKRIINLCSTGGTTSTADLELACTIEHLARARAAVQYPQQAASNFGSVAK